jgi:hypothetical protein
MSVFFTKFYLFIFSLIFLVSSGLYAQLELDQQPVFKIDDQSWHLLGIGTDFNENIRIYGHRDSEKSPESPPNQALLVHVSSDTNGKGIAHFQSEIRKVYPNATFEEVNSGHACTIYKLRAPNRNDENPIPEMIFIMAKYDLKVTSVSILYALTVKCKHCLRLEEEWTVRLEKAQTDPDEEFLIIDEQHKIPLHSSSDGASFQRTPVADQFYPWILDFLSSAYTVAAGTTTLLYYGGKLFMGMMGIAPPCKRTGNPICCCAPGL